MQQIDHRVIKLVVGVIAVSLALFMQIASREPLRSISESYHYRARDLFVGLLFAVAAMFISHGALEGRMVSRGRESRPRLHRVPAWGDRLRNDGHCLCSASPLGDGLSLNSVNM